MASLTYTDKRKLEKLFGMSSGYVLDFSNRTFAEFITDSTGKNIYDARYDYNGTSKANRFRAFWTIENDETVAKVLDDLLAELRPSLLKEDCTRIIARLQAHTPQAGQPAPLQAHSTPAPQRTIALQELKDDFLRLAAESNRQKAGFALEQLLNQLFHLFDLEPRAPFRITGEQIDGSFVLDHHVYLIEAKWERDPLPEAPLLVFRGKIEGKSTFTRGVLIALNDVTIPARDAITRGKAPNFFVMNGHDLLMILSNAITLPNFLRERVRLLGEEGRVCVPYHDLKHAASSA